MRHITSVAEMHEFSHQALATGRSLGLVPTMGALHDGHWSLVRQARQQCDTLVVSIFVNPAQFGPSEDLARYPRQPEKDLELLGAFRVDAVFRPDAAEIYPEQFETFVELGATAARFEGTSRPGHFRGVATVVLKLFNIVTPDVVYFGQKDLQQFAAIRRMVEDLNVGVRLVVCPTVREADGLAMSSRNAYLSAGERQAALALHGSLRRAEELAHAGESSARKIIDEMRQVIAREPGAQLDYAAIVEPVRLEPVEQVTFGCVAIVAARVGPARLIDNLIFGPPGTNPEALLDLAFTARPVVQPTARIPGLETEALRLRIERCRECAALTSVQLPPREFLVKYLKRDYPDLNKIQVAIVGRDSPLTPDNFLYRNPVNRSRFVVALYDLLGVMTMTEFKRRCVLTDALRCHASASRAPEKALAYCAKHLRDELKLFPHLEAIVVLGEDAYLQFQRHILERPEAAIRPFEELLKGEGWFREEARIPALSERPLRVFYCYHPTYGYKRSPSIAHLLG